MNVSIHLDHEKWSKQMNRKKAIAESITTEPNIGKRILAGLIDYSIIGIFYVAYIYAFGEPNNSGGYTVHGLMVLPVLIFWGIFTIGLEQWFGATLGNQIVGLKPLSINGINRDLSFGQSTKRHLLDPLDMSMLGLIGIIVIQKTEKNQRIGDIWAETVVIKDNEE